MSTDTSLRRRTAAPAGWVGPLWSSTRAAAFWLAVALPLAYLPLLVLVPSTVADPAVLFMAVSMNLLALIVGHDHEPSLGPFARGD